MQILPGPIKWLKISKLSAVHHSREEGDVRKATNRKDTRMRITLPLVSVIIAVTVSLSASEASPRVEDEKELQVPHSTKVLFHQIYCQGRSSTYIICHCHSYPLGW